MQGQRRGRERRKRADARRPARAAGDRRRGGGGQVRANSSADRPLPGSSPASRPALFRAKTTHLGHALASHSRSQQGQSSATFVVLLAPALRTKTQDPTTVSPQDCFQRAFGPDARRATARRVPLGVPETTLKLGAWPTVSPRRRCLSRRGCHVRARHPSRSLACSGVATAQPEMPLLTCSGRPRGSLRGRANSPDAPCPASHGSRTRACNPPPTSCGVLAARAAGYDAGKSGPAGSESAAASVPAAT